MGEQYLMKAAKESYKVRQQHVECSDCLGKEAIAESSGGGAVL